jgi:hypothetical protein
MGWVVFIFVWLIIIAIFFYNAFRKTDQVIKRPDESAKLDTRENGFEKSDKITLPPESQSTNKNPQSYSRQKREDFRKPDVQSGNSAVLLTKKYQNNEPLIEAVSDPITYSCRDCMVQRRDECFGRLTICEDFVYAPHTSFPEFIQSINNYRPHDPSHDWTPWKPKNKG